MEHLPIQTPFGDPGIGFIDMEIGSGFQAIGRDVRPHRHIGCLAIGNPEEEVGSGLMAIGSIAKCDKFGVRSLEFGEKIFFKLRTTNSELITKGFRECSVWGFRKFC
jgi:hypothetical protein